MASNYNIEEEKGDLNIMNTKIKRRRSSSNRNSLSSNNNENSETVSETIRQIENKHKKVDVVKDKGRRREGFLIESEIELRTPVENIDDDKNEFIGCQGQICVLTKSGLNIGPYLLGTGILLNKDFEINGINVPITDTQLIVSCAHNFIQSSKIGNKQGAVESAAFSYRKTTTHDGNVKMDSISNINSFHVFPKYLKNPSRPDSFNDIAISLCADDLKNKPSPAGKIRFSTVNAAKEGNTICVVGYPGEHDGKLCYMKGTIQKVVYNVSNEDAIILYDNINATPGQDGSPVYLELSDGSWRIIGFHVGYNLEHDSNVAVGLTPNKVTWFMRKAYETKLTFEISKAENYLNIFNNIPIKYDEFLKMPNTKSRKHPFPVMPMGVPPSPPLPSFATQVTEQPMPEAEPSLHVPKRPLSVNKNPSTSMNSEPMTTDDQFVSVENPSTSSVDEVEKIPEKKSKKKKKGALGFLSNLMNRKKKSKSKE